MVERQPSKLNVEGSNPFGRSNGLKDVARSPGYVAKLDSVTVVGDGYEVIRRFP